ncbi:MAG TPA: hypothetical protein VIU33_03180 [Nitrospiria bacterium]
MTNHQIAETFREIAGRLELEGSNPFRIRAYLRAADTMDRLPESAEAIAKRGGLRKITGIGKDLEQKILDLLTTGAIREDPAGKEGSQLPDNVALTIPGLNPKITRLLQKRFRMETWEDLERLARSRLLRTVPELGPEIERVILKALERRSSGEDGKPAAPPELP